MAYVDVGISPNRGVEMKSEILVVICMLVLICASLSLCFEDDDRDDDSGDDNGDDGNGGDGVFKLYEGDDEFDWDEDNENAKPLTGLEVIELAMANIDMLAPNSKLVVLTSTSINEQGADKATGKAIAWQIYFYRPSGDKTISRVVNVAEGGGIIAMDDHEVSDIAAWNYKDATIDTDDLPNILAAHNATVDWLSAHPGATVSIQSSSGPFGGPDELSWLMWYKDDGDSYQVYISAIDGEILE